MTIYKFNNGLPYPDNVIGFDRCTKQEFEETYKFKHFHYNVYITIIESYEVYLYDYKTKKFIFTILSAEEINKLIHQIDTNKEDKNMEIPKKYVEDKSKFIVIDGVDGCGKGTQVKLVEDIFKDNKNCCFLSFPNYGHESCAMVEKYLHGEFGDDPDTIDPYLAASFYTIDRALSFHEPYYKSMEWKNVIFNNGLIIADRYTSANIIHQGSKLPEDELVNFIRWLYTQEYKISKIPQPDLVIFLNINEKANEELIKNRMKEDPSRADIHEKNFEYINKCRKTLDLLANTNILDPIKEEFPKTKYAFINVSNENGEMRSRLDIFKDIMYHITIGG